MNKTVMLTVFGVGFGCVNTFAHDIWSTMGNERRNVMQVAGHAAAPRKIKQIHTDISAVPLDSPVLSHNRG